MIRTILWTVALLSTAVIALCLLTGCRSMGNLVGIRSTGPVIEAAPKRESAHEEKQREAVEAMMEGLGIVKEHGAEPQMPAIGQLEDAGKVVTADIGAPVQPWHVPDNLNTSVTVHQGVDEYRELLREHKARAVEYQERLDEAARTQAVRTWEIGSGWLSWKTFAGLAGAFALGIGALLKKLLETKAAFTQVVGSVQTYLDSLDAEKKEAVKLVLASEQDEATKAKVSAAKG